ncbi:MAG: glycosyltransferase, partial [bacterium]|nr:glycosyltransferase [bacterium]
MKTALVYDRINKFGGAERVLLALHEIFPEAPLYTSVYDPIVAPWAKDFDVRTSFIQKLPLPKTAHEYYPFLMGPAFETFNFDEYDVVISVTHEFAKAIITKPQTKHICYCLTPTSYLWSGYDQYFSNKPVLKFLSKPMVNYLRWYDKIICHRPDKYIAISKTVQSRIKKYYGLDSDVIYPPVNLALKSGATGSYFLIVSRLVPNKRIDIAVEAFNKLELPLKIIGSGRELASLRSRSGPRTEFLGYLTDEEVKGYYERCRAVIIPGEEDFNIVAVEAQSYGKPVIAYRAGGVTETVIEGKTGYFFDEPTAESLIKTVQNLPAGRQGIKANDCVENAKKYS